MTRRNPHLRLRRLPGMSHGYVDPTRDNSIAGIGPALKAIDDRADKVRAIGLRAVADALGLDLTELAIEAGEEFIRMQVESPFTRCE